MFDKALTLLDQPKETIAKTTKRVRSLKQSLKNLPFKILHLISSILLAGPSSMTLLLLKSIAYPRIYPSNFDVRYAVQKTQSSN